MNNTILHRFDDIEIHCVVVGPLSNNVYIVRDASSNEAVLIDAANEHERLLELCRALGVTRVIQTHGHDDHIGAVPALRDAGYSVAIAPGDSHLLPSANAILTDSEVVAFGRHHLIAHATPGHTPGSISFELAGHPVVFSGDTLFPGGPGATRFPGGDFVTIIDSIKNQLFARFGPETLVLPGHGSSTTIGAEHPHLSEWIERGW
ncbi:MAG: MBL fold metallo-hydrolase [Ferrimicrobium sp.]